MVSSTFAIFFSLVLAFVTANSETGFTQTNQNMAQHFDVGCNAARNSFIAESEVMVVPDNAVVPICLEGGLWQNVQCQLNNYCFCAYIDTGSSIGDNDYSNYTYDELLEFCPVQPEFVYSSCNVPPVIYPCNVTSPKYFYNEDLQQCEEIPFGCYGFETMVACQTRCYVEESDLDICSYEREAGHFCNENSLEFRYYHDIFTGDCHKFVYRGCGGNGNNYLFKRQCQRSCDVDICSHERDEGHTCNEKSLEFRYYHDIYTGDCHRFVYRGCGGNENKYSLKWQCQRSCVNRTVEITVRVNDQYIIRLLAPVWIATRYELEGSIKTLGVNRFLKISNYSSILEIIDLVTQTTPTTTKTTTTTTTTTTLGTILPTGRISEEVGLRMTGNPTEICEEAAYRGPCRAFIPRWYYDSSIRRCRGFIYGGCLPNGNNFDEHEDCTEYCNAEYPTLEIFNLQSFTFERVDD